MYVRDTYILLLHALYIGYALTSEVVSESKYSIKPSHATAASVLSVVGECVSIVYQRLSFFFSSRNNRASFGLVLLLGIPPPQFGPCSQLLYCAACMHTHSELIDKTI